METGPKPNSRAIHERSDLCPRRRWRRASPSPPPSLPPCRHRTHSTPTSRSSASRHHPVALLPVEAPAPRRPPPPRQGTLSLRRSFVSPSRSSSPFLIRRRPSASPSCSSDFPICSAAATSTSTIAPPRCVPRHIPW